MSHYLTTKEREAMNKSCNAMLRQSYDNLLTLCNQRETEDLAEIKRIQPDLTHERALRVLALNKRINKANQQTEDLIIAVDPRWKE